MSNSTTFDSVIVAAERLYDSGYKARALYTVMDGHTRLADGSVEDEIRYYNYCNILYNNQNNYDKSIELADSMLWLLYDVREDENTIAWRSVAYNAKAEALFAKGRYSEAYNYYYLAQKLAKDNKDSCSLRTYSYSLAMTLFRQQRYRQAATRFKEAFEFAEACPDEDFNLFYFKQELLDNIGLCYNAMKKYDSAMFFYNKALVFLDEHTGKFPNKLPSVYEAPKAVVYGNMAEVYVHQGKYDSAKILYRHSVSINLQKGYTNNDAMADQVKLAGLYFTTGDIDSMRATLNAIDVELDSLPDKRVEMLWNKLMWQYYEHVRDSGRGFRHLRAYAIQDEEYRSSNKEMMATNVDMHVSDLEKQYKIDKLTKDKKLTKIFLAVLTVLTLMVFVIGYLVWMGYRRSQKHIVVLKDLNNTIKKQKTQLEVALDELMLKEKDKARILNSVAHDVMNPIAAIVSLTDILLHDAATCTPDQLEIINLIKEASVNSLNLSKDIIEASKEIDGERLAKEKTDVNMLVAKAVELLNFRAIAKKQQIITKYPQEHVYAYIYKDRMRRVINNIIVNAIKYSYENSVIEIRLEQIGDNVQISVKDSGIGISEKNKPRIFDMFTEAKMKGTAGEITHGLGLSISLQIARAHSGNIWFESTEGVGSTFYLTFPVNADNALS